MSANQPHKLEISMLSSFKLQQQNCSGCSPPPLKQGEKTTSLLFPSKKRCFCASKAFQTYLKVDFRARKGRESKRGPEK